MTDQLFAIKGWETNFENNRTKELKKMSWVPIPNSFDGEGYTEIMDHENGPEIYCAWILLVHIASKSDQRGVLIRSNGEPHTPRTLARLSRTKMRLFEDAIPFLAGIGWLVAKDHANGNIIPITQDGAGESQGDAEISQLTPLEQKELKRRELKEGKSKSATAFIARAFDVFYGAYPRHEGKKKAREAFEKAVKIVAHPDAIVIKAHEYAQACAKDQVSRTLIKLPATWLNGEHWNDEYKKGVTSRVPSKARDEQELEERFEKAIDALEAAGKAQDRDLLRTISDGIVRVFGEDKLPEAVGIVTFRAERGKDGAA